MGSGNSRTANRLRQQILVEKLTRERAAVPHRMIVQRSLRYRLAEESA
jgi:hypothetical protein